MMSSDQRIALKAPRPRFDFADVDQRETSKAWNRFLANRNAPSLPLTGVRSVIYQSWVRSNTTVIECGIKQPPGIEFPGGFSDGDQFGMGGRVLGGLAQVVTAGDDAAVAHDHTADRHLVLGLGLAGLGDGTGHPVFMGLFIHCQNLAQQRNPGKGISAGT